MTDGKRIRRRKFAHEILGFAGISGAVALILFFLLINIATAAAENYCFMNDVPMTEFDWMAVDRQIFGVGALLSVLVFSILFLSLLRDRLDYVRRVTAGIDAMRLGQENCAIPLEGNNELTALADAINYMTAARQQVLEKERSLAEEKDQLVRALSHDIRTPLTSVLAYSEYLATEENIPEETRKSQLRMIRKKAEQIRELTDILLDGARRSPEHFVDARLLMEQLAAEFEESLEERFSVRTDLSGCGKFAGTFDVQELRRIFDNLGTNVQKYADPAHPVFLTIQVEENALIIRQSNASLPAAEPEDSFRLGIPSIRRIAQHYGGTVAVRQEPGNFAITILLSKF